MARAELIQVTCDRCGNSVYIGPSALEEEYRAKGEKKGTFSIVGADICEKCKGELQVWWNSAPYRGVKIEGERETGTKEFKLCAKCVHQYLQGLR